MQAGESRRKPPVPISLLAQSRARPIINKIDLPGAEPDKVREQIGVVD
jgi:translation elongation factor EF-4